MSSGRIRLSEIISYAKKERHSMQIRLISYLVLLIISALAAFIFLGIALGVFSVTEDNVSKIMEQQLENLYNDMVQERKQMEGYSYALSSELTDIIENEENSLAVDMSVFNDQPDRLETLQESFYPEISSTFQLARASGAFAVLDATTNTKASDSGKSKSGIYLRLYSISSEYSLDPRCAFFRGIPDVARKHQVELHNRWNLEFSTSEIPGYEELLKGDYSKPSDGAFWCTRQKLPDTWENVILYQVPIIGSNGSVYGSCGVEYSQALFKTRYEAYEDTTGTLVSVIAPVSDSRLLLNEGLVGDIGDCFVNEDDTLHIKEGKSFNYYRGDNEEYVGMNCAIPFQGKDGTEWDAAVLMPQSSYSAYASRNKAAWIGAAALFLLVMIILAIILSRRYVRPIKAALNDIREGNSQNTHSEIQEIRELMEFVREKERTASDSSGLPPNIAELFDSFAARVKTLTSAEHNIFLYYVQGREISEIPDLAFISINTVRKHNRSIYEKLRVASKDELMLYVELFERCGRLDDLMYRTPAGEEKIQTEGSEDSGSETEQDDPSAD